jgi:serine/threonine protein kinase
MCSRGIRAEFTTTMNNDYEGFCMADPTFYDTPSTTGSSTASPEDFELSLRPPPPEWLRTTNDNWVMLAPADAALPAQGWKIHVSGCLDNASRLIEAVWAYAIERRIAFKFLRSRRVVLARNAKYAPRGGSGKLLTVYPADEATLERACAELGARLAGEPGPYILSDLRLGAGPVHVRYGGFRPRHCTDATGETVPAIEDATGELVPDVRGPVFAVPPWVTPPSFLSPHLAARAATTVASMPYDVTSALHFSNGGGVYAGTCKRTGASVVLKEARPWAGLSADGSDAVARLRRERDTLAALAGVPAVPSLHDYLTVGEHEFLVMEHVEGEALKSAIAGRCPLLDTVADESALRDYARWALAVHEDVSSAIAEIHSRGVVYGDLHTFNVIVRPDGRVALIDFEVADQLDGGRRPGLGAVGFAAPADRRGADIDLYALACLRLALFLPLAPLVALDRGKAADLARVIASLFPVPREWLDEAVDVITRGSDRRPTERDAITPDRDGWHRVRASMTRAILASATPSRDDRLFPGDITQFRTGGLNVAHGAAGVLYALDVTGAGRFPDHEEWLIRRAKEPGDDTRLGFYDGMHGVAHVLAHLGHNEEASKLIDLCLAERWETVGDELYGGLAGIGLNCAHLADVTGDPVLHDAAERATQLVADRLGTVEGVSSTSGGSEPYAGLMRGSAGRALLFVRMYERTGSPALLDCARTALRQDLKRCVPRGRGGQLHVDEGWRSMPYLAMGSVGIGLVLRRYLAHRPSDSELAEAAVSIRGAAQAIFYVQSSLFDGRAGMVMYLADLADLADRRVPGASAPAGPLADQIRRLDWHALTYGGGLAFPGDQLLRLSMDLATGSAGVLLALGAALHDEPVHLPFLGPPGVPDLPARPGVPARRPDERR